MSKSRCFVLGALLPLLLSCGGEVPSSSLASSASSGLPDFNYEIDESVSNTSGAAYEIFVGSFADSNGDGVGDLKGIEQHLPYLKSLGVTTLWLTPIHPSNSYHKYDVLDYYGIDSSFGTLADFTSLVNAAKADGMGIMMDMVFNHASKNSDWFMTALDDFVSGNTSETSCADDFVLSLSQPATNPFGKKYYSINSGGTLVYYEANFASDMPEFNLASSKVIAKQKAIMAYWLNQGASGFRFDGAAYYFYGETSKCVDYCSTLYQEATALKSDVSLVAEAWLTSMTIDQVATYSASNLHVFDFPNGYTASASSLVLYSTQSNGNSYANALCNLQSKIAAKSSVAEPTFFIANHDMDRTYSSYVLYDDPISKMKLTASLNLLTPGTPYIYYGEEIMMRGNRGGSSTDANRRLGMIWSENNDTARPSDPVGSTWTRSDQPKEGALDLLKVGNSIVSHYRKCLNLRNKFPAIRYGTYSKIEANVALAAFKIDYQSKSYLLVTNLGEQALSFDAKASVSILDEVNTLGTKAVLTDTSLTLQAYSSVLCQY